MPSILIFVLLSFAWLDINSIDLLSTEFLWDANMWYCFNFVICLSVWLCSYLIIIDFIECCFGVLDMHSLFNLRCLITALVNLSGHCLSWQNYTSICCFYINYFLACLYSYRMSLNSLFWVGEIFLSWSMSSKLSEIKVLCLRDNGT